MADAEKSSGFLDDIKKGAAGTKLKKTTTKEKNVLPTKEDLETAKKEEK